MKDDNSKKEEKPTEDKKLLDGVLDGFKNDFGLLAKALEDAKNYPKVLEELKELKNRLKRLTGQDTEEPIQSIENLIKGLEVALKDEEAHNTAIQNQFQEQMEILKEMVKKLSYPPNPYGIFWKAFWANTCLGRMPKAEINIDGRNYQVAIAKGVNWQAIEKGELVRLNPNFVILEGTGRFPETGQTVVLKKVFDKEHLVIVSQHGGDLVVPFSVQVDLNDLEEGDYLLMDPVSQFIIKKIPKMEITQVELIQVPDVSWADIGGLDEEIKKIRHEIFYPFFHRDDFEERGLHSPRGIILYGPPGCGKTLIAKAIANEVSEKFQKDGKKIKNFLYVKGPELFNKFVGESEANVRRVFNKVREIAKHVPTILFFDEMDSLFSKRTGGETGGERVQQLVVNQLLAEIDGLEDLSDKVIILGATNRADLLDAAVIRTGRFDRQILIPRPKLEGVKNIFNVYLKPENTKINSKELGGTNPKEVINVMIDKIVKEIFSTEKVLGRAVSETGKEVADVFYSDFVSGSLIKGVVIRAKKEELIEWLERDKKGDSGLTYDGLLGALEDEYKEKETLQNIFTIDDFNRISKRISEKSGYHVRIVNVVSKFSGRVMFDVNKERLSALV